MSVDDTYARLRYRIIKYDDRIEYVNADKERHRTDGPAVEHNNGRKEWWVDDKRHRTDGPAIEYENGATEYWINNYIYLEEEFNERIKQLSRLQRTEY